MTSCESGASTSRAVVVLCPLGPLEARHDDHALRPRTPLSYRTLAWEWEERVQVPSAANDPSIISHVLYSNVGKLWRCAL